MKFTTPALINNKKKMRTFKRFIFGDSTVQMFYHGRHKTDPVQIYWIEASQFGKLQTFPCVLDEDGDAMVFDASRSAEAKRRNAALVQRWPLFVTPANVEQDYIIEEMDGGEFYGAFGDYRRHYLDAIYEQEMDTDTAGEQPAEALPAAEQPVEVKPLPPEPVVEEEDPSDPAQQ